jgi:hypothetical protein
VIWLGLQLEPVCGAPPSPQAALFFLGDERPLSFQDTLCILSFIVRGVAQLVSALRLGRRGPRFKSGHPDYFYAGDVRSDVDCIGALFLFPDDAINGYESKNMANGIKSTSRL